MNERAAMAIGVTFDLARCRAFMGRPQLCRLSAFARPPVHDCWHRFASSPCPRPPLPDRSWSFLATMRHHLDVLLWPSLAATPAQVSRHSASHDLRHPLCYSSRCRRLALRGLLRSHRRVLDRALASSWPHSGSAAARVYTISITVMQLIPLSFCDYGDEASHWLSAPRIPGRVHRHRRLTSVSGAAASRCLPPVGHGRSVSAIPRISRWPHGRRYSRPEVLD